MFYTIYFYYPTNNNPNNFIKLLYNVITAPMRAYFASNRASIFFPVTIKRNTNNSNVEGICPFNIVMYIANTLLTILRRV